MLMLIKQMIAKEGIKVETKTQAEYDALVEAGEVDPDVFYMIKDEEV